MAQITIREKDLTGNPAASVFDVAFVPGLTIKNLNETQIDGSKYNYGTPYYFYSLSVFQGAMGDKPVELTGEGVIAKINNATDTTFFAGGAGVFDNGYLYAVELLSKGMPIYYCPIEGTTAQAVYDAMKGIKQRERGYTRWSAGAEGAFDAIIESSTGSWHGVAGAGETAGWFVEYGIKDIVSFSGSTLGTFTVMNDDYTIGNAYYEEDSVIVSVTFNPDAILVPTNPEKDVVYAKNCTDEVTITFNVWDEPEPVAEVYSIFDQLVDRGTYNVKYITSGGYPTFEYDGNSIVFKMLEVAGSIDNITDDYEDYNFDEGKIVNGRGDAVALIDHFEVDDRPLIGDDSVFGRINKNSTNGGLQDASFLSYGAMFTPYANYTLSRTYTYVDSEDKEIRASTHYFPASFAYMTCLAEQLSATLPSYEAIAGVTRGTVKNIVFNTSTNSYEMCTKEILTNYIANHYNALPIADGKTTISINAITQINPYGMVIYGIRTLAKKDPVDGVKATGVLNIRNMVSDIKKQMYQSARRYMFSANNDALWINFRSSVVGLLNQMQQGYGIKSYSLRKDTVKSTKSSLFVLCSIQPVYPVEKFDITIEITDEDIEMNEA